MGQTLVIGSSVVDVIIKIEHLPVKKEDIHIIKQSRSLGGCAYLVSDILRHFHAPYSLCTAVGGGMYGNFVYEKLQERGVPIHVHVPEEENGCCYCMVEADGERTFIVDHGIEYTFYEDYLKTIDTASIDSVYICGLEVEEYTGWNIINYLQKHPEYQVYFAPGPRILKIEQEKWNAVLALHPVLHLNEQESIEVTNCDTVEQAAKMLYAMTQNTVIITLGEKGAYCFDGSQSYTAEPIKTKVVDTIGAGDAHIGAVIAARRFGCDWEKTLLVANHVSAAVVAKEGGLLAYEDFAKIRKCLDTDFQITFD